MQSTTCWTQGHSATRSAGRGPFLGDTSTSTLLGLPRSRATISQSREPTVGSASGGFIVVTDMT